MYSGFVYKWTNLVNGKKYIGSHKGSIDDGYLGSGKVFKQAIKKYGLNNFKRDIICLIFEEDDILLIEDIILKELNCGTDPSYYNLISAAKGGSGFTTLESAAKARATNISRGSYKKISERMKENNPNKDGKANKKRIKKYGNVFKRKTPVTDIEKKNISRRMKENNPNKSTLPWKSHQATEASLLVWKNADNYYSWWIENKDKSYHVMAKTFGYSNWLISHVNMIKKFRSGWNPHNDKDWIEFKK